MVGAYVLAAELARSGSEHQLAFERYQARMTHYVDLNQALATSDRDSPEAEKQLDTAKRALDLD